MRIGFASADWANIDGRWTPGGAGYYRAALPARYLAAAGHDVAYGMLVRKRTDAVLSVRIANTDRVYTPDIIVLQRWMHDGLDQEIRNARAEGQAVVNDLDDWFFGIDPRNRAWWATHPQNPHNEGTLASYARSIAASTLITASTPYLAQRLRERFRMPVVCIPNGIDIERYTQNPERDPPVFGWVGATPWRSGDLEILRGVLGPFLRKHRVAFHHAGAHPAHEPVASLLGLDDSQLTTEPMRSIEDYPAMFARIDVGLVPLSPLPFNRAKSAIKGLEYGACRIAVVASDMDEYRALGCLTAKRPRDWVRHLEAMLDPAVRMRHANAACLRAWMHRMDQRVAQWERALQEAATMTKEPVKV